MRTKLSIVQIRGMFLYVSWPIHTAQWQFKAIKWTSGTKYPNMTKNDQTMTKNDHPPDSPHPVIGV